MLYEKGSRAPSGYNSAAKGDQQFPWGRQPVIPEAKAPLVPEDPAPKESTSAPRRNDEPFSICLCDLFENKLAKECLWAVDPTAILNQTFSALLSSFDLQKL